MLYFTTFARSPHCTNFYKNRFGGIYPGRNHMFTISAQPVTGFWFCEGSNFAISHRKAWSPLTRCLHYRAARDVCLKRETAKEYLLWSYCNQNSGYHSVFTPDNNPNSAPKLTNQQKWPSLSWKSVKISSFNKKSGAFNVNLASYF